MLPLAQNEQAGLYDDAEHGLRAPIDTHDAITVNRFSISNILGVQDGVTLQFVANEAVYSSCYSNPQSLIWRESGALGMTIALCATALSLSSVLIGRHGDDIVRAIGLTNNWRAVGAIHITANESSSGL